MVIIYYEYVLLAVSVIFVKKLFLLVSLLNYCYDIKNLVNINANRGMRRSKRKSTMHSLQTNEV